jgi:DNA-damage-inducible protein J
MAKTAHLNARLEPGLKTAAERILTGLGVRASDAVTMFYRQVLLRRGLPFDVCLPNAETSAAIDELDRGGGEVYRGSGREIIDAMLREEPRPAARRSSSRSRRVA